MPLTEPEWLSISAMVEKIVRRVAGTKGDYFITGKVLKVDKANKCIYLREFGDQPIPLVGFEYEITYYDESPRGTNYGASGSAAQFKTRKKKAKVEIVMPRRGQTVLVAREMGAQRMPRCLGVIQGKKWIIPEAE
jgi:hypothetical protein